MTNPLLPYKWLPVAQYVYDEYLSKPYTSLTNKVDWDFNYEGETTPRPNHGLPHHLRVAAYVTIVVKAYNFFQKSSLSSTDVDNIQLSLLFYVVGRENETTHEYEEFRKFRQKSADAFEKYVRKNLPSRFTENQLQFYKRGIFNAYLDPSPHQYTIIRICHNLDLLRCYTRPEYNKKIQEISSYVGPALATLLAELAEECLRATGDRIMDKQNYNGPLFNLCSKNAEETLRKVEEAFQLKQGEIMNIINPTIPLPAIPLDLRKDLPDPSTPWMMSQTLIEAMEPPKPGALYKRAQVFPEHKEWRFIWRYFQHQKPIRYGIKRVFAILERHQRQTFEFNLSSIEREAKTFPPSWKLESRADQRALAIDRWQETVQAFSPFHTEETDGRTRTWTDTKVVPLWHGTNDKICDSICTSGFVYFGKNTIPGAAGSAPKSTDDGYFGSGIYFTNSARYAADIYSKGHLLLAWVSMREPFPIVGDPTQTDMKTLRGKGAHGNYNAHYVPVAPENPKDPYCPKYFPLQLKESPTCDEYVVFQKSQTLPQFWIELEVENLHLMAPSDFPKFVSELTPHLMKILQNPDVDKDLKLRNILSSQLGILLKQQDDEDLTEEQQQLYRHITVLVTTKGIVEKAIREMIAQNFTSKPAPQDVAKSLAIPHPVPPAVFSPKPLQTDKKLPTSTAGPKKFPTYVSEQSTSSTTSQPVGKKMMGEEPFENYLVAAEGGNPDAEYKVGVCYYDGKGVKKNEEKAVKWFEKAANQGNADAQFNLGVCYEYGQGIKQIDEEAVKWYKKAAEQGHAKAQLNLGLCYENGVGIEESDEKAVHWYRLSAEQGNVEAQLNLGICYSEGQGVDENDKEAFKWYKMAADQGHPEAQFNVGDCYENGKGIKKNKKEAFTWYKMAAEQGEVSAQYNLGNCYADGQGVEQNYKEAVRWYKMAAEQGDASAKHNLAVCYEKGQGVKKNPEEAVKWYQRAADQGYADSQFNLGTCYEKGQGVEQDDKEAFKWFRLAAEQGGDDAQFILGSCYEDGRGIRKNKKEAIKWYKLAAEQGNDDAKKALDDLST